MNQRYGLYRCPVCGNVVEMVVAKEGALVCCGQPMEEIQAGAVDAAVEKHLPVITKENGGIKVSVGSVAHPMTEAHFIQWIELTADSKVFKRYLNPGDEPVAFFPNVSGTRLSAREYCNLHGLWAQSL